MKKGSTIISVFLLVSCSVVKNDISYYQGKYQSRLGFIELNLQKDKFSYLQKGSLYTSISKGVWSLENGFIVLKSKDEFKTNLIEVKEFKDTNSRSLKVMLHEDMRPLEGANIIFNNNKNQVFTTNSSGILKIDEEIEISSILVIFIGDYMYNPNNGHGSYEIIVYPDVLSKTYFKRQQVKVKPKGLILNDTKLYKEQLD
ncbi:MAG: hypothetical protein AAFU57_06750 [Bacteroidota bacterium]